MASYVTKKAATHEENRLKLCLLCKKKRPSMIKLQAAIISKLQKNSDYNPQDPKLPAAICNTCKIKCYKASKTGDNIVLPDYSDFTKRVKRSGFQCGCCLCSLIRHGFPNKSKIASDNVKRLKNNVQKKNQRVKNNVQQKTLFNKIKFKINSFLTSKQHDQLVVDLIKRKYSKIAKKEISLSQQHGKALRIAINPRPRKPLTQFSAADVQKIKTNSALSSNQTLAIARLFRTGAKPRKLFEPGLKEKLSVFNHRLDAYFEAHETEFTHTKANRQTVSKTSFIICNDVQKLTQLVQNKREYINPHLKFGIDGGGGFLKITLSLQNMLDLHEESSRERQSYKDGIASKEFSDAGVKKLLLLGLAPCTQENYRNVSMLWSLLKISDLKGTVATDLKLANILAGLMTHASQTPCTWCTATKDGLHHCGQYRTLGSCLRNYRDWLKSVAKKGVAKNYMNCTNPPVFKGDEDDEIIDFLPPPELHLLTGIVNKLHDHMLQEFQLDTTKWTELCHVQRKVTCGNFAFAGNACKTLLEKVDVLRSFCSVGCLKYVQCFIDFKEVVKSCFSIKLHENYRIKIEKFQQSYLDLKISVTPKVHAVFFHVVHFCDKTNEGLGFYSEQAQAVESAHHDFEITWSKYKVDAQHPLYAERLLKAVQEYNSSHI